MRLVRGKRVGVRRGLSLLEVLASLAIFIISAAALTQMADSASDAAVRARRLTKAQLLAETKMDEVVAGVLPLAEGNGPIQEENDGWYYHISVTPEDWSSVQDGSSGTTVNGLSSVIVTVSFNPGGGTGPAAIEFSLSRLILDPSLRQPVPPPTPQNNQTQPQTNPMQP
jgi:type II secretory pathway pseudopilin PulG